MDPKELVVWEHTNDKVLALIRASINKEVNRDICSVETAWEAMKKLKDMYATNSKFEFIQLHLKLFNLELKANDPMSLASKIKAIKYEIIIVAE